MRDLAEAILVAVLGRPGQDCCKLRQQGGRHCEPELNYKLGRETEEGSGCRARHCRLTVECSREATQLAARPGGRTDGRNHDAVTEPLYLNLTKILRSNHYNLL